MSIMTLEQVRDWHRARELGAVAFSDLREIHKAAADAIDAHLAQPAQAVDVGAIRDALRVASEYEGIPLEEVLSEVRILLTRALSGEAGPWISVEDRRPERNKPAIYWHKSDFGGFAAIADEWRDEHHLAFATHWMPYIAPASPAPDKEGA